MKIGKGATLVTLDGTVVDENGGGVEGVYLELGAMGLHNLEEGFQNLFDLCCDVADGGLLVGGEPLCLPELVEKEGSAVGVHVSERWEVGRGRGGAGGGGGGAGGEA